VRFTLSLLPRLCSTRTLTLSRPRSTAGFVYPFPVIYTGGANPLLWRPLASLRAFDVPSAFIDVSPFLPMCVRLLSLTS